MWPLNSTSRVCFLTITPETRPASESQETWSPVEKVADMVPPRAVVGQRDVPDATRAAAIPQPHRTGRERMCLYGMRPGRTHRTGRGSAGEVPDPVAQPGRDDAECGHARPVGQRGEVPAFLQQADRFEAGGAERRVAAEQAGPGHEVDRS